jgi:hypothetical protein
MSMGNFSFLCTSWLTVSGGVSFSIYILDSYLLYFSSNVVSKWSLMSIMVSFSDELTGVICSSFSKSITSCFVNGQV